MQYRPPDTGNENWRKVWDAIYTLRNNHNTVIEKIATTQVPSVQEISRQLQLGGTAPINITGLQGAQAIFQGNHALRLSYAPGAYANELFFETDRKALYLSTGTAWTLVEAIGYGTFETRWADLGGGDTGAVYIESSRNTVASVTPYPAFRWNGTAWVALQGQFSRAQANLTTLAGTLTANDTGLLADVTDYAHILQWGGAAWNYADPNDPPGRIEGFLVDPVGNGWALCNGANVAYLNGNGNTTTVTLPDFSGIKNAYLRFTNNASANFGLGPASGATGNSMLLRGWFRQ